MKRPYLVQRLNKPRTQDNPFSFGGGLLNGGITNDAMNYIRHCFSFDYMGAAEYEWGAVPRALQAILDKRKKMVKFEHEGVFVIALKDIADDVKEWISKALKNEHSVDTRDLLRLKRSMKEIKKSEESSFTTLGWLKLEGDWHNQNASTKNDEPFMFFIDETMFKNTCELFEIKKELK